MKYIIDLTALGNNTYSVACNEAVKEDGTKKLLHNEISCAIEVKDGVIAMKGGYHIGTEDFEWSDKEGPEYAWVLEEYHPGITEQIIDLVERTDGATFRIYQLRDEERFQPLHFKPLEWVKKIGYEVSVKDYDLTYYAPLPKDKDLDDLFYIFNMERPEDFTGHSMSVSDVVVISKEGKTEAFYVDSFGFRTIDFFSRNSGKGAA